MAEIEKLKRVLVNTSGPTDMRKMVALDASCISFALENPAPTEVMPWAGNHKRPGLHAIITNFADVAWFWEIPKVDTGHTSGDELNAACFRRFTYKEPKIATDGQQYVCSVHQVGPGGFDQLHAVDEGDVGKNGIVAQVGQVGDCKQAQ